MLSVGLAANLRWFFQLAFELRDARQTCLELRRQSVDELVLRDSDRLTRVTKGVLGDDTVLGLAEQKTDGGVVAVASALRVYGAQVEVEFAGVFGFELPRLEL